MAEATALVQWEKQNLTSVQRKLADFVQYFQLGLDVNVNGQPLAMVDPTVIAECLPYADTTDDIPEEKLEKAIIQVDYVDNMPCVDGLPIWERLDGEQIDYYKIFKEYREMKYTENTALNTRSMARLAEKLKVPGRLIIILSKIYHWIVRVRAYDRQMAFERALQRQRNIEKLEFKHAGYANDILDQAVTYLKDHPKSMDPKTALSMLELGMKYGRISVGLLGDKPGTHSQVAEAQAKAFSGMELHQTNVAITQHNTHNQANQMINANTHPGSLGNPNPNGPISEVDRQLQADMRDPTQIMSVLHILNESGALKAAAGLTQEEDDGTGVERPFDVYDDGTDLSEIIDVDANNIIDIDANNINNAIDIEPVDTAVATNINSKAVPGVEVGDEDD